MKKIPVWKNVILLVSVLVVIMIATFAWFITSKEAAMVSTMVHVGKASYLQVSGDEGNSWSEDLDLEIGVNDNFKEISGDGRTFFAPVYDVVGDFDTGYSTQIVSFNTVTESEKYYEQIFEFRTDVEQDIYLSPESSVTSVSEQGNAYIDGAIRVAFFELDANGNETLKCIWAPNSAVQYSAATNSFTREGRVEPYYYYQKSAKPVDSATLNSTTSDLAVISTAGTDANGCGYNQAYKFMWSNGQKLPKNAPAILRMDELGEDGNIYKKLKVKVWLEGHDRECVSLLSGQKFTMKLQFGVQEGE